MIHFRRTVGKTLCGQRSAYKSESTCLAKEVTCSKCKNILLKNTMLMSEEELVWMNDSQKQRHEEEVVSAKELRDINEKLRKEIVRLRKKLDALESQKVIESLKRDNKFLISSLIEKEKKIKSLQDTIDRLSIGS